MKKILILNVDVSGMNRFLFAELEKRGCELFIETIPLPRRLRWWALITTFSLNIRRWKQRFDHKLFKLYKSSWCFKWRTRYCERLIKRYAGRIDLVLQISGMFAPFLNKGEVPYAVYTDYTMRLAEKYEPWASPADEIEQWVELEKKLYTRACLNFVCCENTRKSFIEDYGVDPKRVINVGYGVSFDNLEAGEKRFDHKTILFVGFDFERKGGPLLLEAFKRVRKTFADARLVMIGPSKRIFQIDQEGVEFLGPVFDRNIVRRYFEEASVFAMPSLCEPFGLVFLEAMAHQLPCIGADVDAMPEIIKNGETGFVVDPQDTEQLAERLIKILTDQPLARAMGQTGFERLKTHFSWERVGLCVYNALIEMANCRGA